jgi:NAD(P)-dependent dehydrogenase (short-subunit alcohol dehydrogenase family)
MDYRNAFQFDGKIALVTGAGGTIGREIARGFAQCGAAVVAADLDLAAAQETVDSLGSNGKEHMAFCVDITNLKSVLNMVESIFSILGHIDFLVNFAKLNIRKPALELSEQEWDKVIDCNLKGTFLVSQAVGRAMMQYGSGRIVNFASISSVRGPKNASAYISGKGGIMQLTKALAREWAEKGITVNAVGPGYLKTSQTVALINDPQKREMLMGRIPMRRLGDIEEIVSPILFLCSPLSSYITGQTLFVEGGYLTD